MMKFVDMQSTDTTMLQYMCVFIFPRESRHVRACCGDAFGEAMTSLIQPIEMTLHQQVQLSQNT